MYVLSAKRVAWLNSVLDYAPPNLNSIPQSYPLSTEWNIAKTPMNPVLRLLSLLLALTVSLPVLADHNVGVSTLSVASPGRDKDLAVTVWYPALSGGEKTLVGGGRIFNGTPAFANAPVAPGQYPLILLSHGSGGSVEGMSWIASRLAAAGYIVAGPNHPGTTSGDSTPQATPKLWQRTQDLSTVLNALTRDGQWKNAIDSDRVGVLGFSLGGAAGMQIAGARAKREAYARYCEQNAAEDCAFYAGGKGYLNGKAVAVEKVDLRQIDRARFEQDNRDPRIRAAVIVDPGLAQAYDAKSLQQIAIPVQYINLGRPADIPIAITAVKLAKLTPHSRYAQVNDAVHLSFLDECKDGAAAFLKSVGEVDPICEDAGVRTRADIHAELVGIIVPAFDRMLKGGV